MSTPTNAALQILDVFLCQSKPVEIGELCGDTLKLSRRLVRFAESVEIGGKGQITLRCGLYIHGAEDEDLIRRGGFQHRGDCPYLPGMSRISWASSPTKL